MRASLRRTTAPGCVSLYHRSGAKMAGERLIGRQVGLWSIGREPGCGRSELGGSRSGLACAIFYSFGSVLWIRFHRTPENRQGLTHLARMANRPFGSGDTYAVFREISEWNRCGRW